jgi:hypothetical protein
MNGKYAIKGYLIQSLVALLDSLNNSDWDSICVEPDDDSEKVDIRWIYNSETKKVVQVKSSINIMTLPLAKKWANELIENSPNANQYELVLIGPIDSRIHSSMTFGDNTISIVNKNLSLDDFESIIIEKINFFFEQKGKNIISPKLGQLFARALNQQILQDSVSGINVKRIDFEKNLFDCLQIIETHLKNSSYSLLLENEPRVNKDVKSTIIAHILNLIGWTSLNTNESIKIYDDKLGRDQTLNIEYWAKYDSPLKDNQYDLVYINANLDAQYLDEYTSVMKHNLFCVDSIRNKLIEEGRIDVGNNVEYCIQFLLSLSDSEQSQSIKELNDAYKAKMLNKNIIYCAIDNKRTDFLVSSIITAKSYRDELITKFLYPITEDNSQISNIGKRGTYMPPQYLNSSILPIIKEDKNKISVLLFCSDPYSKDRLKKVVWLLIRLTSGLANEYKIYFIDYDNDQYHNEVNEVIRSYGVYDLTSRLSVEKLNLCNSSNLKIVPLDVNESLKNENFDETINASTRLKIEPHLIEYLPYGDFLKPFLASDAIKSEELKLFLQKKGIYFKTADKTKIIQLMTSMLFSSLDIESLISYVSEVKTSFETSSAQYLLVNKDRQMSQLFANTLINKTKLQNGLKAEIVNIDQAKPKTDSDSYEITLNLEQKNPNKQALVSIERSTAKVTVKKNTDSCKIEFIKEYDSKQSRVAAERIVKLISEDLIEKKEIEDRCFEILFSHFENKERINFLLSFTNIESSDVFVNFNAKSFKYMFDETAEIPSEYQDKKGKECITQLKGKNLDTIRELQDDTLKEIILSEEMTINYRFKIRGISGSYFVIMNFSGALDNKPSMDGVFNTKSKLYIDAKDKEKIDNFDKLEIALKKVFNDFKKEKLQQFNKI